MSFQHFRLGDLALHQPLQHSIHPVHHHHQPQPQQQQQQPQQQQQHISQQPVPGQSQFPVQIENPVTTFSVNLKKQSQQQQQQQQQQHNKQPYGSGDADDGYTLVFANLQEFNDWRLEEEARTMCEFVKGDTHGSKAVPPRFKDHTKLVCARHSRSGRKKYIKKHPERIRKVPSRKLEVGCPASISYKTYFDSEQVRACYISQHSHEIGLANLPFTRRGRKEAAVRAEKDKTQNKPTLAPAQDNATSAVSAPDPSSPNEQTSAPSTTVSPQPAPSVPAVPTTTTFSTAVSMLAPLPSQNTYTVAAPQTYTYAPPPAQLTYPPPPPPPPAPAPVNIANDRWENMATLFQSVREHARNFEYPGASVAALETVLIRLYLESPVGIGVQPVNIGAIMSNGIIQSRGATSISTGVQPGANIASGTANEGRNGSTATEDGG